MLPILIQEWNHAAVGLDSKIVHCGASQFSGDCDHRDAGLFAVLAEARDVGVGDVAAQFPRADEGKGRAREVLVLRDDLRRDITYSYTARLREHCEKAGIPMVALAGKYHEPAVKADIKLFHDGTHLSQRLMPLALDELQKAGVLELA